MPEEHAAILARIEAILIDMFCGPHHGIEIHRKLGVRLSKAWDDAYNTGDEALMAKVRELFLSIEKKKYQPPTSESRCPTCGRQSGA
jgi:hypothetical protein